MSDDQVVEYGDGRDIAIVSYGNGVVTSLRAQKQLAAANVHATVIDTPYLSKPSAGLRAALARFDHVVFADICKPGQNPYAGMVTALQADGALPRHWQVVTAQPTYNPLGTTLTFTSEADIVQACKRVRDA